MKSPRYAWSSRFARLAFALLALPSCSQEESPGPAGDTEVQWTPCALETGGTEHDAECATVSMPLDWDNPKGSTIDLFVKRQRAAQPSGRQVWLLAGGPGGPGDEMAAVVPVLTAQDPTIDIYIPDHRGTGLSKILACPHSVPLSDEPDAVPVWSSCIESIKSEWGDGLSEMTITNAARDLGELIARVRLPGEEVHVMGISYGTFWAQRYLQLYPTQPTSVTLDAVGHPQVTDLYKSDALFDSIGRKLLQVCAADPFCSGKLGPDPLARVAELYDALDAETCAPLAEAGVHRTEMRRMMAMMTSGRFRVGIPALVYRGLRCAPGDVSAITALVERVKWHPEDPPLSEYGYSDPLYAHIILSEITDPDPPTIEALTSVRDAAYASFDESVLLRRLRDIWPVYPRDSFADGYPDTSVPVLLLNGTLDPQTDVELASEIATHYTRPHQTYIEVETAGHPVFSTSPMVGDDDRRCGAQMWISFMHDPEAPVDTSCLGQLRPIAFEGTAAIAKTLFNAADLWENP